MPHFPYSTNFALSLAKDAPSVRCHPPCHHHTYLLPDEKELGREGEDQGRGRDRDRIPVCWHIRREGVLKRHCKYKTFWLY